MTPDKYWFPAKTYGWGWGIPATWQGWTVSLAFFVLLFGGIPLIEPDKHAVACLVYSTVLCIALVGICWAKGEPPRWRWGKK